VNTNHHWSLLLSDGENSNSLSQFNLSHNVFKVQYRHAKRKIQVKSWTLKRRKYFLKKYGTIGNTPIDFYWNELTLWKVSTICYIKLVEKWRAKMLDFTFSMIFKAVSTATYASKHNIRNTFHYSSLLLSDRENSNSLSLFNLSQDASKVHYRHENSTRR